MMRGVVLGIGRFFKRHCNIFRGITAAGFIAAVVLTLASPVQMPDPDDWVYYYGVKNFANSQFTIDNATWLEQAKATEQQGNILLQYLPIAYDKWAVEKAPGYLFYLLPFEKAGIPRWGNVLLALGMVIVTYILLKRLRDEKAAMLGSLLTLFTPIALVMMNRVYMDTYASLAFLAIGGGLYFYYHLERAKFGPVKGGVLLFIAFFCVSWSVITRYTNLPIAFILFLHWAVVRFLDWRKGRPTGLKRELLPLVLGIALPALAMALYDYYIFGSPLTYGYSLTPFPIKFAFQYLGQVDASGESIPVQILRYNLEGFNRNILIGFPLLLAAVPAFVVALYQKFAAWRKNDRTTEKWRQLRDELPWGFLWVLIGWFIFVFGLYLMYEWTVVQVDGGGFVMFDRFMLPGLFPVVVIGALVLARLPYKVVVPVMLALVVYGALLYAQWSWGLHILPQWLTLWTLDSRWPGYHFPPWVEYPPHDSGGELFPWHIWSQGAGFFRPH